MMLAELASDLIGGAPAIGTGGHLSIRFVAKFCGRDDDAQGETRRLLWHSDQAFRADLSHFVGEVC
jgi:hypothetical protein